MTALWQRWIVAWCWGVLLFGAVLAMAAVPVLDAAPRFIVGLLGGNPAKAALLDQPEMRFGIGLQGALTIGWALMMFTMISVAAEAGARVWRPMTLSLLAWYVIDSAISVSTGFPLNALSNSVVVALYLAPVLASGVLRGPGAGPL
jgi:hypothetical protein